jgi:hypothetical protein
MVDCKPKIVLRFSPDQKSIIILVNGVEKPRKLTVVRKLVYHGVHFDDCQTVSLRKRALCDDCVARVDKYEGFNVEVDSPIEGGIASTAAIGRWWRNTVST